MSNYTKTVNFATKDNLSPGNPLKIVKGTEIDTEYNNIATAVATKTDNSAAAITGGAIDGAAIGGTTPAAGAFTTLAASGTTTLAGALVGAATQAAFNTVSTTLNLGGAATAVNIGAATGTATVANTTLAAKAITASTTLGVTGASTLTGAVTASSTLAVTGAATLSSTLAVTGVATLGNGAVLNTPTSATLTNATGLPISTGVSGLGSNVATFLATPSSANLISAVTDETGTGALVFATSPTLVTPLLGTPTSGVATNLTGLPISTGVSGLGTGVATLLATPSSANLASAITDETGSGALVFATSPTLVTPILGTPTSGTLTNATGLPISTGVAGLGTGVATFLATPSSANLLSALTDETGTGSAVFATSPTLVTPLLGTPASGVATNLTGLPLTTGVTGLLPVANGGTATATPSIVAGSNVTVTGTWPNQTIASSSSGGVSYTVVKTANYTAANNDGVLTNTTGGAFTVTLPTSPSVGNIVLVIDSLSQWGTNNLTVDPTALIKIAGNTAGDTLVCDITGATVTLVYTGATYGWNVAAQVGGNGGTAVTLTGTQTLTNKTLTAPIISSISNTGTLTLPTSTDTLVGRATTDTLTNKTLTSPTLTTPVASTTIGVGAATPSASGAGITFPATQSASTDANTLDDYEEGTWSPELADASTGGNTFTMSTQNGLYTKVGNVVTVYFRATWTSKGSASGNVRLRGFPFAAKSNSGQYYYTGTTVNTNGQITIGLEGNSSVAFFFDTTGSLGTVAEFSASDTGAGINGCFTYLT